MASIIGKLVGVPLGEVWGWKAADFTGWLLQKENLGLLASELRFQLELGSYRRLARTEGWFVQKAIDDEIEAQL